MGKALSNNDFNGQFAPAVLQTAEALNSTSSYDEAFDLLAELMPELDTETHQNYMKQALFVADVLGASDA